MLVAVTKNKLFYILKGTTDILFFNQIQKVWNHKNQNKKTRSFKVDYYEEKKIKF